MNNVNPVEKIKKDIYIIKNDINNKVYIGQAINSEQRFKAHCRVSRDKLAIDLAINKYGKEHFWYEIIESQIENYNEKEKYWIQYYNSLAPNGYNISEGGEAPPIYYGEEHPNTKINDEKILEIKKDLRETNLSYKELSKKYNISKSQIASINYGINRKNINEDYPIRKKPNFSGKLNEDDVDSIIQLLKYTYCLTGEIAKEFGVNNTAISDINCGKTHHRDDIKYPIREWKSKGGISKFTYEEVTEIIELLKDKKLSINMISKQFNVTPNDISGINTGRTKRYRRENVQYPIRPF